MNNKLCTCGDLIAELRDDYLYILNPSNPLAYINKVYLRRDNLKSIDYLALNITEYHFGRGVINDCSIKILLDEQFIFGYRIVSTPVQTGAYIYNYKTLLLRFNNYTYAEIIQLYKNKTNIMCEVLLDFVQRNYK